MLINSLKSSTRKLGYLQLIFSVLACFMKLVTINKNYINFLRTIDTRVLPNDATNVRPYLGGVLYRGKYSYYIPLSTKSGASDFIVNFSDGLGSINFERMIPLMGAHNSKIKLLPDNKLFEIFERQLGVIENNKSQIRKFAETVYIKKSTNGLTAEQNKKIVNFKLLEKNCQDFSPSVTY